ncbi:hypothetical protein Q5P01_013818 [Channa striata]|uniref:Uncharacterized protein n=1 Tax=Channa striata TaxID=64152 RepID=A0AA88MKR3_CHASR|nr:hypothetical protein Q5P01_013818 [Channa striata]
MLISVGILNTSAGAVRSASALASQIEDVTAAASCPAAERLQIDYKHSVYLFSVSASVVVSPSSVSPQEAAALSARSTLASERECWRSPHLFSVKGDDVHREERRQGNERRGYMEESRREEEERGDKRGKVRKRKKGDMAIKERKE